MSDTPTTPFSSKAEILSDLWMEYRTDIEFKDFIDYCDLALPLAYAITNGIIESTPLAEQYIEESWDLLLKGLELEDTGFDTLLDLLSEK